MEFFIPTASPKNMFLYYIFRVKIYNLNKLYRIFQFQLFVLNIIFECLKWEKVGSFMSSLVTV